MTIDAGEPETGGLSIADAVAALDRLDGDENTDPGADVGAEGQAAAEGGAEGEPEGAASAPDGAAGEAENQGQAGEEGEASEGAETPLEAPLYWKPEAKAKFALLDPELQAEILAQEGPREAATAKVKEEASKVRERAEQEIAGITRFAEELTSFLPQAVNMFRSRWGDNPDWGAYATEHGVEAMNQAKAVWEAERTNLQQLAQASQVAEQKAHSAYIEGEFKKLAEIAPDLVEPEKGGERRTEITKYLVDTGVPAEQVRNISALEMVLARKAMLYDRLQAKSAPNPPPKKPVAPAKPLARGGAGAGPSDPQAKQRQTAKNRFVQTRSIADAVALLDSAED